MRVLQVLVASATKSSESEQHNQNEIETEEKITLEERGADF